MVSEEWALQPGRGGLRAARCVSTAAPSVALAVAAHAVGGGCITLPGVAGTAALLTAATYPMVSRERSVTFFLGWTTLGQVVGHGILNWFCRYDVPPRVSGHVMLLTHIVAVVLLGLTLRVGEARVWAPAVLARMLRRQARTVAGVFARRLVPQRRMPAKSQPRAVTARPLLRLALWVARCRAHRGPPQALLAR